MHWARGTVSWTLSYYRANIFRQTNTFTPMDNLESNHLICTYVHCGRTLVWEKPHAEAMRNQLVNMLINGYYGKKHQTSWFITQRLIIRPNNYKCGLSDSYPQLDSHCDGPTALQPLEEGARAFLLQDLAIYKDN